MTLLVTNFSARRPFIFIPKKYLSKVTFLFCLYAALDVALVIARCPKK